MATLKELTSLEQMKEVFWLMRQMYPNLAEDEYQDVLSERLVQGYRMVAVVNQKDIIQAIAGFWIGYRFYSGRFVQIDNMIADQKRTIKGCGKLLIDWIKEEGRKHHCKRVILDSYVENFSAHKLFFREGFVARGYHFNHVLSET
jgi:GNAT superfamily N-acetyltransferase